MSMSKIVNNPITDRTEGAEQERNQRNNEQVNTAAKKAPSADTDTMKKKPTDLTITFQKSLIYSQDRSGSAFTNTDTPLLDVAAHGSPVGSPLLNSPLSASQYQTNPSRIMNNPYGLIRTTSPVMSHGCKSPVLRDPPNIFSVENIEKQQQNTASGSAMAITSFANPPPLPAQDQSKVNTVDPSANSNRLHSPYSSGLTSNAHQECTSPNSTFSGHDQLMEIVNSSSYLPDTSNASLFQPLTAQPEKQCVQLEQQCHEQYTPAKEDIVNHSTSTCSTGQSLTKVYQNGRPIPAVRNSHPNSQNTSILSARQSFPDEEITASAPAEDIENTPPVPDFAVVVIQFRRCTELHMIRFAGKYLGIPVQGMLNNAHVITEGDRGYDLGRIIGVDEAATEHMMEYRSKCTDEDLDLLMTFETAQSLKQACGIIPRRDHYNNNNNGTGHNNASADPQHQSMLPPTHILARCAKFPFVTRNASQQEVDDFHYTQISEEGRALAYAQEQCSRCLPLEISIIDATFQFDRLKLTLWYTAPERVYFVSLLKVLNQRFRCRIWMERVESKVAPLSLSGQQQFTTTTATHHSFNNCGNNSSSQSGFNSMVNNRSGGGGGGFRGGNHGNTNNNQGVRQHQYHNTTHGAAAQPQDGYYMSADRKGHHQQRHRGQINNEHAFPSQQTEDINGNSVGHQHHHQHQRAMEPICTGAIDNSMTAASLPTGGVPATGNSYGGRKRVTRYTDPMEADEIVNAVRKISVSPMSAEPTATTTAGAAKRLNFDM